MPVFFIFPKMARFTFVIVSAGFLSESPRRIRNQQAANPQGKVNAIFRGPCWMNEINLSVESVRVTGKKICPRRSAKGLNPDVDGER